MASVTIYVEGGGGERHGLQQVRLAFREFFTEFAESRSMPKVVASGGRGKAYEDFLAEIKRHPDAFVILLVDSECAVIAGPREHLSRVDRWDMSAISDDRVHLMVQAVEAWLIADREALADYFGKGFNDNPLPDRPPEEIPAGSLKNALNQAARKTAKGGYDEIAHCPEILGEVDAATVRRACRHCKHLFEVISHVTGVPLPDLQ
ncbi:MAG: DUF4276 family protein [Armatimonadota bacterium]|jgi:hypothetical protein